MTVPLYTVHMN